MLANLRIRSKLALLLAAPMVGLVLFAGLFVRSALEELDEARAVESFVEVGRQVELLLGDLRAERAVAVSAVAAAAAEGGAQGALADHAAYQEAIAATDARRQQLDPQRLDVPDATVRDDLSEALARSVAEVDEARERLLASAPDHEEVVGTYTTLVESLTEAGRVMASQLDGSVGGDDLDAMMELATYAEALAVEQITALPALARGSFASGEPEQLRASVATAQLAEQQLATGRSGAARDRIVGAVDDTDRQVVEEFRTAIAEDPRVPAAPEDVVAAYSRLLADVEEGIDDVAGTILATARTEAAEVRQQALTAGGSAAGVVLVALLLAVEVSRQTVRPLRRLTSAAEEVAGERLPRLVDAVRAGDVDEQTLEAEEPIDVGTRDEVADLARAFESVRATAVSTAGELAQTTREGVSELFVNLARRNQTLIDRQISVLDKLERETEDPEDLERLFSLDHLATRMRRNAESLLVLAGSDTPRRWSSHLPLTEVLHAAVGEVHDYRRVSVAPAPPAEVAGRAAADLAHLLAELVENATSFSPPDRPVVLSTAGADDGALEISVRDHGLGMSAADREAANVLLASPPPAGFEIGRSLGLVVCGLLAQRHGVAVRLEAGDQGGTVAQVRVPADLLAHPADGLDQPAAPAGAATDRGRAEPAPIAAARPEAARLDGGSAHDPGAAEGASRAVPAPPPSPVTPSAETPPLPVSDTGVQAHPDGHPDRDGKERRGRGRQRRRGSASWSLPAPPAVEPPTQAAGDATAPGGAPADGSDRAPAPPQLAAPPEPATPDAAGQELPRRERGSRTPVLASAPLLAQAGLTDDGPRRPESSDVLTRYLSGGSRTRRGGDSAATGHDPEENRP